MEIQVAGFETSIEAAKGSAAESMCRDIGACFWVVVRECDHRAATVMLGALDGTSCVIGAFASSGHADSHSQNDPPSDHYCTF